MRKFVFYFLLLTIFFTSCSKKTKNIIIAYIDKPATLSPNVVNRVSVNSVLGNFYNSLVEYDPFMKIKPSLAYAWINTDDTTWVFYLRKNVYFHNGARFTGEDVRYTIRKVINDPHSEFKKMLENIESVKIINDYQLKITTKTNDPHLLGKLASIFIESKSTVNDNSLDGTGPLLPEMIKPQEIVATPFRKYFGESIKCSKVYIKFYGDYKKMIDDYKEGKIDLIAEANYFMVDSFKNYNQFVIKGVESTLRYLAFNLHRYPLNNKDFRKAISFAIDRSRMARDVYKGLATPANQYALPFLIEYDFNRKSSMYDLDSAEYYLKKSGVKTPCKLKITASSRRIDMINFLSKQLSKINITVVPDTPDVVKLFKEINTGNFDMFLLGSVPDIPDLSDVLMGIFYTRSEKKGIHNRAGYTNREVDSVLDLLTKNRISKGRKEEEWKVQSIILDDIPVTPLVYEKNYYVISNRIEYIPRSDNTVTVKEIKLK
ncbi:MAG: hypothetical protein GWP03_00970 [Proteobacteria bacterium]|nr:hypothetical protein [Pseudomonadota bacterium]